jgi:hypothetical protein
MKLLGVEWCDDVKRDMIKVSFVVPAGETRLFDSAVRAKGENPRLTQLLIDISRELRLRKAESNLVEEVIDMISGTITIAPTRSEIGVLAGHIVRYVREKLTEYSLWVKSELKDG